MPKRHSIPAVSEPLFPLTQGRIDELIELYGLENEPRIEKTRVRGRVYLYWFIGSTRVGSDDRLASVLAELRVARRVHMQQRDDALAEKFALQKSASAGGGRRSRGGIDRGDGRRSKDS